MTGQLATTSGECFAPPSALLLPPGKLVDPGNPEWGAFARSWDDLPRDTWMADSGTYRRRRYAAFEVAGGKCTRLPHRAHYQERDHNPLNGGIERWFAPMCEAQTGTPLFQALVMGTASLIADASAVSSESWMVEAHQFRIEALSGQPGLPTPEGMHHDGRDWVLILLVGGSEYAGEHCAAWRPDNPCVHDRCAAPCEHDARVRHLRSSTPRRPPADRRPAGRLPHAPSPPASPILHPFSTR